MKRIGWGRAAALAAVLATVSLAACGRQEEAPAPAAPVTEQPLDEVSTQRVTDLVALDVALQAYFEQNQRYPATPNGSFINVISAGTDWIPGLAPQFIQALPRDPANSTDPNSQYWYASSGGNSYKLVVHGVGDACGAEYARQGIRLDPARTSDGSCWAYGFFTDDMSQY